MWLPLSTDAAHAVLEVRSSSRIGDKIVLAMKEGANLTITGVSDSNDVAAWLAATSVAYLNGEPVAVRDGEFWLSR